MRVMVDKTSLLNRHMGYFLKKGAQIGLYGLENLKPHDFRA